MYLWLLYWFASAIQIAFCIVCLASGLYYLADLVEEYTVITKRIIKALLWIVGLVHAGLAVFEGIPLTVIGTSFLANAVYALLLKNFPFVEFTSLRFVGGFGMLALNHYIAFQFFLTVWHPFAEILAYFTVCLWLVPFIFFVSLSASENVLPTMAERTHVSLDPSDNLLSGKRSRRHGVLALFNYVFDKTRNAIPLRAKTT
ncbi:protein TEX261-like [Oscarella lobularis]|uniref:protein TEX261-like n=1 Tax=Oscarella lobularis TaxID=121494 RepID=UPI003313162C